MKPVDFEGSNLDLAKDQPEYQPLPVNYNPSNHGMSISCWELSDEEIEVIKNTKQIWFKMLTFNRGFSPILIQVDKPLELTIKDN